MLPVPMVIRSGAHCLLLLKAASSGNILGRTRGLRSTMSSTRLSAECFWEKWFIVSVPIYLMTAQVEQKEYDEKDLTVSLIQQKHEIGLIRGNCLGLL